MEARPEIDPKLEVVIRRWPMWMGVALLFMAFILTVPVSRKARIIQALDGWVETEPGFFVKSCRILLRNGWKKKAAQIG